LSTYVFRKRNFVFKFDFFCQEKLQSLINDQPTLKPHSEIIFRQPSLYGDYRTALDMGEARIYEDIQDYDAAKALFEEV
jgi:hypothetical protein